LPPADAQPAPRLAGLDLLRGLAAYLVVTSHCAPALAVALGQGSIVYTSFFAMAGVELFFALSGFLIGGILIDLPPTRANLRIFLVRRWLRTLPVYYLVLLVYLAFPRVFHQAPPEEAWRYFLFLQNLTSAPKFFGVSWSLAIEEWFYVLLPVLLYLRVRYLHAVLLLIAAGVLARALLPVDMRASVLGRLDAIAYGCLIAWLMRSAWRETLARNAASCAFVGAAGMAGVFALLVVLVDRGAFSRHFGLVVFTLMPLCAAMTVPYFAGLQIRSAAVVRVAAFGAAVSYPIYLWHNELVYVLQRTAVHPGTGWLHVAAVFVVATAVAHVTHILVERPFMRMRPRLPKPA
jgi:peptidoglycan/LPS O-acetylase OafA/YrhL